MRDQFSRRIPIADVTEDCEFQCRATQWNVDDLVTSIQRHGQRDPVAVRPLGKKFQLIYGFRRVAALKQLGHKWVQAHVMYDLSDADARRMSLAENLEREDLSDWDKIATAARFNKQGITNGEIAANFNNVSVRTIQRWLCVAKAPDDFRRALERDDITVQQCYEALKRGVSLSELMGRRGRSVRYLRSLSRKRSLKKEDVTIRQKANGETLINIRYRDGESDLNALFATVRKRLEEKRFR